MKKNTHFVSSAHNKFLYTAILSAVLFAAGCNEDSSSSQVTCGEHEKDNNGVCVCDNSTNYYGETGNCTLCEGEHKVVKQNQCACDTNYEDDGNDGCKPKNSSKCNEHEVESGDGCICDNNANYYGDTGNCTLCEGEHKVVKQNQCVCDTNYEDDGNGGCKPKDSSTCNEHEVESDDGCICDNNANYYGETGNCTLCEGEHKTVKENQCVCEDGYKGEDTCIEDIPDPCESIQCSNHGTCRNNDGTAVCDCELGFATDPNDQSRCISVCKGITCGDHGVCYGETGTPVCDCEDGYNTDPENALSCVTDTSHPCYNKTCDDHGTCVPFGDSYYCICDAGYIPAPKRITCWEDPYYDDYNFNYMKDSEETAPDKGKDCRDKSVRHSCSDFCDSFIGYQCSTKCKFDAQCINDGYFCRSDGRCAPKTFETVWVVTEPNSEIQFPGGSGSECDYTINWGDDSEQTHYTDCAKIRKHTYNDAGEYIISVSGTIDKWSCLTDPVGEGVSVCGCDYNPLIGKCNNNVYLTSVLSFGPVSLGNGAFAKADKLKVINQTDIPDSTHMNMVSMFQKAYNFNQPINHWDTSNVNNMSSMFNEAKAFNQSIVDWDTSNVESMTGMFDSAFRFNQPLNNWDTSKVKDMSIMFYDAESFNQSLNSWNTSTVTTMMAMFNGAKSFDQPLDNWDTSNVENMSFLFYEAKSFNQPINNWNTSNVEFMSYMFYDAKSFNYPLDNWNTSKVESMSGMFQGAESFNQPIEQWNTERVTEMDYMFKGAKSFNQPLNQWITISLETISYMFEDAESFNQSLDKWRLLKIGGCYTYTFNNCALSKSNWDKMVKENYFWASLNKSKLGLPADY